MKGRGGGRREEEEEEKRRKKRSERKKTKREEGIYKDQTIRLNLLANKRHELKKQILMNESRIVNDWTLWNHKASREQLVEGVRIYDLLLILLPACIEVSLVEPN